MLSLSEDMLFANAGINTFVVIVAVVYAAIAFAILYNILLNGTDPVGNYGKHYAYPTGIRRFFR